MKPKGRASSGSDARRIGAESGPGKLMRLQRALARAGVTSRRKAEDLIRAGRVRVDGVVASVGESVDPDRQRLVGDGRAVHPPVAAATLLALNKPIGVVVSR